MLIRNFFLHTFGSNRFGFAEVFSRFVNWSTLPIVGLLIDPASFGQVVFLSTIINILTTIGTFGQHRVVLHYGKEHAYESYGAIFIALLYALSFISIGYLSLVWYQGGMPAMIVVAAFLTVLHALLSTQQRAFGSLAEFTLLRTSLTAFRFSIVVSVLVIFENVTLYIFAEIFALLLSFIANVRSVSLLATERKDLSVNRITKSGKLGFPILIQSSLLMAIMHYDKVLLARFDEYSQLGQYGFLFMLSASLAFVSAFIGIKYEVLIYQSDSHVSAYAIARKYQKELIVIQISVASLILALWFFTKSFIAPNNSLPWFVLPVLFAGQIFGQSVMPWSTFLTRTMALLPQVISVAIPASMSIALNSILIPEYGATGAAITFLLSNTIYFYCILFAGRSRVRA